MPDVTSFSDVLILAKLIFASTFIPDLVPLKYKYFIILLLARVWSSISKIVPTLIFKTKDEIQNVFF